MKTQKEYMEEINTLFRDYIIKNQSIFDAYNYRDNRANDYLRLFRSAVELLGLKFSNCYHANGIGNNNQYYIYLESIDDGGFIIKRIIAEFYYCHGIYGGCFVSLTDASTGEKLKVSRAR